VIFDGGKYPGPTATFVPSPVASVFQPVNVYPVRVAVDESAIVTLVPTAVCETGIAVVLPLFALNVTV
jgi:hypothetical protein